MGKRMLSFLLIFLVIFNVISYNVFAQEIEITEINEPIFKVVLPTNLDFVIDPYEIIDKASMIASPDFNIINKSSVPVKINLSFKVSNKDGSIIDIKNNRNEISNVSYNNEIWIAALFSKNIENVMTNDKVLCTQNGDIIYRYSDGIGIKREKISEVPENNNINPESNGTEGTDKANELNNGTQHKANESDVINDRDVVDNTDVIDNNDSADDNSDANPSNMPTQVVSGSVIATQKSRTTLPTSNCRDIYAGNIIHSMSIMTNIPTEAVSGSVIVEAVSGSVIAEAVSGSAVVEEVKDSIIVEEVSGSVNVEEVNGSVVAKAVSGSAIIEEAVSSAVAETVSGSAIVKPVSESVIENKNNKIITDNNKETNPKNDSNTQTQEEKSKILTEYEEGIPIIYQDTIKVTGQYGDIKNINEKSPNVLVINNNWNSYSIVLDAAKVYNLSDGSITTGEVAENNQGAIAFRLFGYVNQNAIWKNAGIQITAIYSIEEYKSVDNDEMKNDELKNNEMNNSKINTNDLSNNMTNNENNNTVQEAENQVSTDSGSNSSVAQESETVIQLESDNSKTESDNIDSVDEKDKGKESGPDAYSSDQ